jgi:peptidoglycan hydrolase-like protein with peptidoglycan-binding domain
MERVLTVTSDLDLYSVMRMLMRQSVFTLVLIAVCIGAGPAWAHGGGLDKLGCHHDRKAGGYHCHRGPLSGQYFRSKNEALAIYTGQVRKPPARPPSPPASARSRPRPAPPPFRATDTLASDLTAAIQRQLKELGFNPGSADGLLGAKTETAIRAYQRTAGLPVDGLATMELLRGLNETVTARTVPPPTKQAQPTISKPEQMPSIGVEFGRNHALIIGIDAYQNIPRLTTAVADAKAVARVLRWDYGYEITLLDNATRADIIGTLDGLRKTLTENDNLLLYYAGHGWLDKDADRGYWLPVDATRDSRINWVSNTDITDTLKAMRAKHVMVVADSCYSGTLTRGLKIELRTPDYLSRISAKKARTVLTSGGLEPVADTGSAGHSVFAKVFLEVLRENTGAIDMSALFPDIRRKVMLNAKQIPQYSDIRYAGHEGGDFLFVRRN